MTLSQCLDEYRFAITQRASDLGNRHPHVQRANAAQVYCPVSILRAAAGCAAEQTHQPDQQSKPSGKHHEAPEEAI